MLIELISPYSALAVFRDDFKLADSSEVHNNLWIEIRPRGNNYFVCSWVDKLTGYPGFDGYIRIYTLDGMPVGNTVKLGDDSLEVTSPIFLGVQNNGNIVAAWLYHDIVHPPFRDWVTARIYDSLLNPITSEIKVDTISDPTRWRALEAGGLGVDSAGNFVVLYAVDTYEAFLQRFNWAGERVANPVGLYTPFAHDGEFPCQESAYVCTGGSGWDMDMRPNGELIVVYYGETFGRYPQYNTAYALGRLFNANLTPKSQVFIIPCEEIPCTLDDTLLLFGSFPKVEYAENGDFIVTWNQGYDPDWTYLIGARRFNADGTPKGPPFIVNDHIPGFIYNRPRVAVGKNGDFVVFWSDRYSQDGWHNLWAQAYDSSGTPQGINYRVNNLDGSLAGNEESFDACILDSTFVIAWMDGFQDNPPKIGWPYGQTMELKQIGIYLEGDVNPDGDVNLTDLIFLVNYVFKGEFPPYPKWAGDVDANCMINIADLIYMANQLFASGPSLKKGCAT